MRKTLTITAAIMTAAIIGGACSSGDSGGKNRVVLEAAKSAGDDPFTTKISYTSVPKVTVPAPEPPPATTTPDAPIRKVSGGAPGLYGGTRDQASCDVDQLVSFLESHPAEAKAWAAAENVDTGDLGEYIRSLTPVLLRVDTRVTNHGFKGGRANPLQAVLQAGTAVLVDDRGVPRTKCACGNPLLPPAGIEDPQFTGDRWEGFKAAAVVVVDAGPKIDQLVLVDPATGQRFARPVGGDGSTDAPAGDAPADPEAKVFTGTGGRSLTVTSDVPFAIATTHTLRGDIYQYGPGTLLQKGGTYNFGVEAGDDVTWRVVVRPFAKLRSFKGAGDTDLGSPSVPEHLIIDLRGEGTGGNFYLTGQNRLLDEFTAAAGAWLKDLSVADHQNAGWTLDLWAIPNGCQFSESATRYITCAA